MTGIEPMTNTGSSRSFVSGRLCVRRTGRTKPAAGLALGAGSGFGQYHFSKTELQKVGFLCLYNVPLPTHSHSVNSV